MMNAVFGLAFRDQIFAAVPGAFVNPYQGAPLDMYSRDFYSRRSESIEARLDGLSAGFEKLLLKVYDEKFGISNRWINGRFLDRSLLADALHTIPWQHYLHIITTYRKRRDVLAFYYRSRKFPRPAGPVWGRGES